MLWEDILRTLGGMAILVAALAWLTKSLLTALLSKDLEKFKSDMHVSSQQNIEAFKGTLQLEAQRHAVEFSSLHAKRAELIAELYKRLAALYGDIRDLDNEFWRRESRTEEYTKAAAGSTEPQDPKPGIHTPSPEEEQKARSLQLASRELLAFYSEKKVYFSTAVCNLIDSFIMLTGGTDGRLFVNPSSKKFWVMIGQKIPQLQTSLEKEFRILLGVHDEQA